MGVRKMPEDRDGYGLGDWKAPGIALSGPVAVTVTRGTLEGGTVRYALVW